jgi:hypothetical protein
MPLHDITDSVLVNRRFAVLGCASLGIFACSLLGVLFASSICFVHDSDEDLTCTIGSLSGLLLFILLVASVLCGVLIVALLSAHPDSLDDLRPALTRSFAGVIFGNGLGLLIASGSLAMPPLVRNILVLPSIGGLIASTVEYHCIVLPKPRALWWIVMGGLCWFTLALLFQVIAVKHLWLLLLIGLGLGVITTVSQWRLLNAASSFRRVWLISRWSIWILGWSAVWLLVSSYCFYWRSCAVMKY